jgi:hypothetical protein
VSFRNALTFIFETLCLLKCALTFILETQCPKKSLSTDSRPRKAFQQEQKAFLGESCAYKDVAKYTSGTVLKDNSK